MEEAEEVDTEVVSVEDTEEVSAEVSAEVSVVDTVVAAALISEAVTAATDSAEDTRITALTRTQRLYPLSACRDCSEVELDTAI